MVEFVQVGWKQTLECKVELPVIVLLVVVALQRWWCRLGKHSMKVYCEVENDNKQDFVAYIEIPVVGE